MELPLPLTPRPRAPTEASPLIIQVDQVPDIIAEVDSGHDAARIGLAAARHTEAEPRGPGMRCPPLLTVTARATGWLSYLGVPWSLLQRLSYLQGLDPGDLSCCILPR